MRKLLLISFAIFFTVGLIYANDLPKRPNPPVLVNDFINFLDVNDKNFLEAKLKAYNDSTSTQIVIVIVDDLQGYDKAEYAYQIGQSWGVGQKGKDNGLVILVKPTGRQGERGVFIATGYGLESILTDALCKRIIEREMIPRFKQNDIAGGINKSVDVIMGLLSGSFTAEEYKDGQFSIYYLIPLILLILIFKFISTKSAHIANKGSIPFWTLFFMANSMNGKHTGSYSDFSSGRGGFGGFGGGGFGGGGAGGSW